jgi:hypothetical protein
MHSRILIAASLVLLNTAGVLPVARGDGPAQGAANDRFSAEDRAYWALRPVRRPAVPRVANSAWGRGAVDTFILARLEAAGMKPMPEADRRTLIRRASFDLHGLPPTAEQVDEFLADQRPNAYERLIDRLLASPRYGERWARHWLDLVRYAESDGYNQDAERPHAWRYRDYVIAALNADKAYDRFIAEQVAGDELMPGDAEALAATGFLRHWPYEYNQRNVPQQRTHILNDLTDVTGQVFLGLTIGCARCHDHKFDPILQKDYFRLQAFFASLADRDVVAAPPAERRERERRLAAWQAATHDIRGEIERIEAPYRQRERQQRMSVFPKETQAIIDKPRGQRSPWEELIASLAEKQLVIAPADCEKLLKGDDRKRWDALHKELARFAAQRPPGLPVVMSVADVGPQAPPTIIPGESDVVAPGFLSILDPKPAELHPTPQGTGRRTALARWLTDPANPLVARVMVNRLWHHHFRRGLVATPNDLGRQGDGLTHPELLDWLSSELIAGGWRLKHLHRLMMTSATYRQASAAPPSAAAARVADPDNKLLWRMRSGRLEAEAIRDSLLAVSGELTPTMGGPSVYPELPPALSARHEWKPTPSAAERNRRTVYAFVKRNLLHPLMESFDMPDPHESCARRQVTTTAPQALVLLNGEWALDRAADLAARVLDDVARADGVGSRFRGPQTQESSRSSVAAKPTADPVTLVAQAYRRAFSRPASAEELALGTAFLKRQGEIIARRLAAGEPVRVPGEPVSTADRPRAAALVDLCHALLNSNEFVYVD